MVGRAETPRLRRRAQVRGVQSVPYGGALLASLLGVAVGAQPTARTLRIGDDVRCGGCKIELRSAALVDDESAPQVISDLSSLVRLTDGRFLATQFAAKIGLPILIGRDSRVAAGHFAKGQGPGEFQVASRVARWISDSVLVLDPALGRISVLTPSGMLARTVVGSPLARSTDVVALPSGDIVASLVSTRREDVGAALQLFRADWRSGHALGERGGKFMPADRNHLRRRLALAGDGGFWAGHVSEYEIEKWSREGFLTLRVLRDAPWFTGHRLEMPTETEPPPRPLLVGIWEDADGLLWSVSLVADRGWRSAFGPVRTTARGSFAAVERADRYVDTIVEVIDVGKGCVLARTRMDGAASTVDADGIYSVTTTNSDGTITASLHRARLLPPYDKRMGTC